MASFEDTVIATGRDTFHRLDELEDQHPLLTDKSGNGIHATCFESAPHLHGQPSPIETDPSSSAMSGKAGRWTDTINRFNTFCWFAFGSSAPTVHPKTLLARSGQWSISGSCIMGFNAGGTSVLGRLKIGGISYSLSAPCVPNNYYMVALRYNAGVIDLLLNAVVVATDNATGDMEVGSSTEFRIGGSFSIIITQEESAGVDEVATGSTLNDAQLLEILTSSKNSLALHGYSNVLPSAVWISQPDATPIHFPSFRHNFEEPILERISFLTNNSKTLGGSVESSEMRIAPRREVEISHLVRSDEERRALRAKIWAHQHKSWFVPIRQDFEQLAASLSSGVQTLPISTQYKDFEADSWVGIREIDDEGKIVKSEILQIDALNPNDVHTTTPTVNSYSAFLSYIYPVRRGIISRSFSIRGHTDAVEEMVLVFELFAQDEAVIPNRIIPWTPTIVYKGYEAHDPAFWQSHNWVDGRSYDIDRALSRVDFETGIFEIDSDTPGAEEAFEYRMLLKGRDKIAQFLGWFYSRGGSLSYLWIPSMQKDFEVTGSAGADVTVVGKNYSENFALAEARRNLAFVYQDFTMVLRQVIAFSGSPDETLTVVAPSVPTLTNLRSLSILKFCQMESDSVEIAWVTDDLIQVAWRFKELLSTPV